MTSRFIRHKRPILKEAVRTVEPVRLRWLLNPRGGFLEDVHRRPSSETSGFLFKNVVYMQVICHHRTSGRAHEEAIMGSRW